MGHAIWSISIPIAMIEMLTPARRTTPWLGNSGLAVNVLLYLFGCWIVFRDLHNREGFLASPAQMIGAALVALALILIAFALGKRAKRRTAGWAPKPRQLGVGTLVCANVWFVRPENWVGVTMGMVLFSVAALVIVHWSRRQSWNVRHEFALVAGTLPTYAWAGFVLTFLIRPEDIVAWMGNIVFALMAVALLIVTGIVVWRAHDAFGATDMPLVAVRG
jgi:hypothetical protein